MNTALGILGPSVLILLWYVVGEWGFINELYIPRLEHVVSALVDEFVHEKALVHIGHTVYRSIIGFVIAAMFAIPCGVLIGMNRYLKSLTRSIIDFFRSLPAPTLFPIFLLFFGLGDDAKIASAACYVFWILLKQTTLAITQVSPLRMQVAKIFGASKFQTMYMIVLRDATPQIVAALRTVLPLSLMVIIIGEIFLGGSRGIGFEIINNYTSYRIPEMYAYIVITGMVGFLFDYVFGIVQKKFTKI